ncbi:hypothetical protein C8J55DRAFT_7598 [Lentinula edodes]|uniref:Uncharacterized protein n=1 Tax=Lentinula lateritia TaxID=40482 RepID=A0A9W9E1I7_9AGAR|nr:hypothetical protein C8J55DRAFT_7598 [Lentinula edodes]
MGYHSVLTKAITVGAASSVVLAFPVPGFPSNDLRNAVVPPITDMLWMTGMPIPLPAQGQSPSVTHKTEISGDFLQNQDLDDLFSEVHQAHDNAKVELDSEKLLDGGGELLPHPRYGSHIVHSEHEMKMVPEDLFFDIHGYHTSDILEGMTVEAKDQITSIFDDAERREGLPLVHTKRGREREDTMSCSSAKTYLDSLHPDIKNIMAILFKDWSFEARGDWIECDRQWDPFLKSKYGKIVKKMGREYPKLEFEKFVHAFLVVNAAS